jgi:acyl-ACP thioesterase
MVIPPVLTELPADVEFYETGWPVRLADTDANQLLLLDAVARYLQDIGYEHLDVMPDGELHRAWVVRRTVMDILKPVEFGERATLRRWCNATSNRWCNMRVQIKGSNGGLVETEAFLIHFSEETGMPARMTDAFVGPMLASTDEHRLRWKAVLTDPLPSTAEDDVQTVDFPLRVTDIDRLGHVNNSVYLSGLEEALSLHRDITTVPYRVIIEYTKPLMGGDKVELVTRRAGDIVDIWFAVSGEARAVAQVRRL